MVLLPSFSIKDPGKSVFPPTDNREYSMGEISPTKAASWP